MKLSKSKIEILLAEKQLTKTQFADASGMSRQTFCIALTRGYCLPKTAGRIAQALNVKVTDIIETED